MNINQVSQKFNLSKDTLRYWEKMGLLPAIARDSQGYRSYSEQDQNWIFYIKVLRQAGMPIQRLKAFITAYRLQRPRNSRKQMLEAQKEQLQKKAKQLEQTLSYLTYKIDHFDDQLITFEQEKLAYDQGISNDDRQNLNRQNQR